jgi:hypothetical protein
MTDLEFHELLENYRCCELRAASLMQKVCAPFCIVCEKTCCRVGICKEAAESPFLLAVQGMRMTAQVAFDTQQGYLGDSGCKLDAGRPPVCHAFVCGTIAKHLASDEHLYALECLGDLVGFIGKKVWRGRQLVEALTANDLRESNITVFQCRLATATSAITILEEFWQHDRKPGPEAMRVLSSIRKPR